MISLLESVGKRVVLDYPAQNILGVPLEYYEREIEVESFRSIAEVPLSLESFLTRPMLRRGETMITGRENGESRKYYAECARGGELAGLQFVLTDDDEPEDDPEPISRVYLPTVRERRVMLASLDEIGSLPLGLTIGIRAVRLE